MKRSLQRNISIYDATGTFERELSFLRYTYYFFYFKGAWLFLNRLPRHMKANLCVLCFYSILLSVIFPGGGQNRFSFCYPSDIRKTYSEILPLQLNVYTVLDFNFSTTDFVTEVSSSIISMRWCDSGSDSYESVVLFLHYCSVSFKKSLNIFSSEQGKSTCTQKKIYLINLLSSMLRNNFPQKNANAYLAHTHCLLEKL